MRMTTVVCGICSTAIGFLFSRGASADSLATQVIAVTGAQAPGTGGGVTFRYLGQPTLNSRGDTAFGALLSGNNVDSYNDYAFWLAPHSATAPSLTIAYRGTDSTSSLRDFSTLSFNAAGQFLFWANSGTHNVLLTGVPGQFQPIVTTWDPAPGIGGGALIQRSDPNRFPRINDAGDVIFDAVILQNPYNPDDLAKFVVHNGAVEPIVYSRGPAPGLPGTKITNFNSAIQSPNGHIAFISDIDDLSIHYVAWVGTPGALLPAASGGQKVSTPSGDLPISGFSLLAGVNDAGLGAFTAILSTGPTTSASGVLAFDARDGLRSVAVPGTPVPALGAGVVVNSAQGYEVNNRGEVRVDASLIGPDPAGQAYGSALIWKDGTLKPVLTVGDAAPGIDAGINVASVAGQNLNDAGQFLIRATLAGPNVDTTNNSVLWATDPLGHFQLVARTGATIEINGADRVVKQVTLSNPYEDGGSLLPLNDAGQLTYQLKFTDGSVANMLATLPSVIAGDADNDLAVTIRDFNILADHYGQLGTRVDGDFDYDGSVTYADFQILQGNFGLAYDGTSVPVSDGDRAALDAFAQSVPEPSGALIFIAGAAIASRGNPRHRRGRRA